MFGFVLTNLFLWRFVQVRLGPAKVFQRRVLIGCLCEIFIRPDAGLVINKSWVRIPAAPLSSATMGKLLTHMCLCNQAV